MNHKELIYIRLTSLEVALKASIDFSRETLRHLEAYYDSLADDDFPHRLNIERFIYRYKALFSERTLSLLREAETLCKDWQLKAGTFDKLKGVWKYE